MTTITLHEYLGKIDRLIDDNRFDEAIGHGRHVLESYPRCIAVYRLMGKAYLEKHFYEEAEDLFQRVLSAEPNDLIAHTAMAILYKETGKIKQALWHLEHAFEIDPYNTAIRDELRQLYAEFLDELPFSLPLTSGAAAHLYLKGEMYQQAVQVLQEEVTNNHDRVDLQVLLAEALWQGRDDQRIDAEAVCLDILDEMPDCIVANSVLATIWLRTGRVSESQKYLSRVKALTCVDLASLDVETAVGRAFLTDGAPDLPDEHTLSLLDIEPEAMPVEKPSADWVSEVSFDPDLPAGDQDIPEVVNEGESGMHSYDWMIDVEAEGSPQEKAAAADSPFNDTDWFADVSQDAEEIAGESGTLSDAVLGAMAFSLLDSDTDTLEKDKPGDSGSLGTDWFAEEALGASAAAGLANEKTPNDDIPDWLLAETGDLEHVGGEGKQDSAEEIPDWLSDVTSDELEPLQMTQSEAEEWAFAEAALDESPILDTENEIMGQVNPEAENEDDWLEQLSSADDQQEDIFPVEPEKPEGASTPDDEDWLSILGDEEAGKPQELAEEQAEEEDWLAHFDAEAAEKAMPLSSDADEGWLDALPEEPLEESLDSDSHWLAPPEESAEIPEQVAGTAGLTGALEAMFEDEEPEEIPESEDLEDWLSVLADEGFATDSLEDLSGQEATAVAADQLPDVQEDEDWLSVLSGEELTEGTDDIEGALEPSQALEDSDLEEIPDWLMTAPLPEMDAEAPPAEIAELSDDFLGESEPLAFADSGEEEILEDWMTDLAAQPEADSSVFDSLGVDSDLLPDWMVEEEEADEPAEELDELALAEIEGDAEADEFEEFPDWLKEASETTESVEQEAALADIFEAVEVDVEGETAVTGESESQPELPLETAVAAAGLAALSDAEPEDELEALPREDTQWLDQLAEEGDSLSELDWGGDTGGLDWLDEPEAEKLPEPEVAPEEETPLVVEEVDIGQDGTVEDVDDTLSWLEELAAQQESPVEELPSVAQRALADNLVENVEAVGEAGSSAETDETEMPAAEPALAEVVEEADTFLEMQTDLDEAQSWLDELVDTEEFDEGAVLAAAALADQEEGEVAEDAELADALAALAAQVEAEGLLTGVTAVRARKLSDAELDAALDWLEAQNGEPSLPLPVEEETAVSEPAPVETQVEAPPEMLEEPEELDLFDMPDDPDAAVAWLEAMAASEEELDIEMEPAPIKPSEDAVYVHEETAVAEPELEEMSEETAPAEDVLLAETDTEEIDVFEMPDDPDAAIAWLEAMASGDELLDIEMEPAPIKPSEDAVYIHEEPEESPAEPVEDQVETAVVEPDLEAFADIPEDPDAALAWFEAMAADDEAIDIEMEPAPIKPSEDAVYIYEETTPEESVPDLTEGEDETSAIEDQLAGEPAESETTEAAGWLDALATQIETGSLEPEEPSDVPDWMIAEADVADDLLAEADLLTDDFDLEETLLEEEPFEAPLEKDVSDAMPAWFDLDANETTDLAQSSWMQALPEVDVDSWLVAEQEATAQPFEEAEILPESDELAARLGTGELRPIKTGDTGLLTPQEEDDFAVVEPDSALSLSIDDARLSAAQAALAAGNFAEAAGIYQELVGAGGGMMILIAELETAVAENPDQPAFRRALGDAYMRNGQLQKALDTYRAALDQL